MMTEMPPMKRLGTKLRTETARGSFVGRTRLGESLGRLDTQFVAIGWLAPQASSSSGVFSRFTFRSFGTRGGASITRRLILSGHINAS